MALEISWNSRDRSGREGLHVLWYGDTADGWLSNILYKPVVQQLPRTEQKLPIDGEVENGIALVSSFWVEKRSSPTTVGIQYIQ